MQYSAICIKAYGDRSYPEYYPQIDEKGYFVVEPGDNSASSASFTNLQLEQNGTTIFTSEHGLNGKLFITDSRIVLMCDDYDSGGFLWIGNPLITAIAGVASAAAAKSRTAGTVLTGHVRYEWLSEVKAASDAILFGFTDEMLTIDYQDPFGARCSLKISLKNTKGLAQTLYNEIKNRRERQEQEQFSVNKKTALPAVGATSETNQNYCSSCGNKVREKDKFCKRCGVRL